MGRQTNMRGRRRKAEQIAQCLNISPYPNSFHEQLSSQLQEDCVNDPGLKEESMNNAVQSALELKHNHLTNT